MKRVRCIDISNEEEEFPLLKNHLKKKKKFDLSQNNVNKNQDNNNNNNKNKTNTIESLTIDIPLEIQTTKIESKSTSLNNPVVIFDDETTLQCMLNQKSKAFKVDINKRDTMVILNKAVVTQRWNSLKSRKDSAIRDIVSDHVLISLLFKEWDNEKMYLKTHYFSKSLWQMRLRLFFIISGISVKLRKLLLFYCGHLLVEIIEEVVKNNAFISNSKINKSKPADIKQCAFFFRKIENRMALKRLILQLDYNNDNKISKSYILFMENLFAITKGLCIVASQIPTESQLKFIPFQDIPENTAIYKGVLWVDTAFDDIQQQQQTNYDEEENEEEDQDQEEEEERLELMQRLKVYRPGDFAPKENIYLSPQVSNYDNTIESYSALCKLTRFKEKWGFKIIKDFNVAWNGGIDTDHSFVIVK